MFVLGLLILYARNLLIVGWPSVAWVTHSFRELALEIVWLTLAEVAAEWLLGLLIHALFVQAQPEVLPQDPAPISTGAYFFLYLVGGAVVGLIVRWFTRSRWGMSNGLAWTLACVSAVLANPGLGAYLLG